MSDHTELPSPRTVLIVGGGIGGLMAAVCLTRAGLDVRVIEQAEAITEVGAGLQVAPNSTKCLEAVGLGPVLAKHGVKPDCLDSFDMRGQLLAVHDLNEEPPRFGANHYLMYRPDLIDGLRGAAGDVIELSARAVGVQTVGNHAEVSLEDGRRLSADLVIGADGIRSTVRQALFGPDTVTYSGRVGYRAVLDADRVAHLDLGNTSRKYWGPVQGHHLVHYFVAGGRLFNVFAVLPQDEWTVESWTAMGDKDELRDAFADFADPVPEIIKLIEEPYKWALNDRPPLDRWSKGRIALLGDACHPMVPFLGQGATMAIEDAVILSRSLAETPTLDGALRTYEATRRARTVQMQSGSRTVNRNTWKDRDWIYEYNAWNAPLELVGAGS